MLTYHFLGALLLCSSYALAQKCYYAAGSQYEGPDNLIPCNGTNPSTCCLAGDVCVSGNACWNAETDDLYQYGCTDINYEDETCPYKCGWNPDLSPYTTLEYCNDLPGFEDIWVCLSPESCGCEWNATFNLVDLQARSCSSMGSDARVALYAPLTLLPYVSLPSIGSRSTGYFSATTVSGSQSVISTVINGYTPANFIQFTSYIGPSSNVTLAPDLTPAPSTLSSAIVPSGASFDGPVSTTSSTTSATSATSSAVDAGYTASTYGTLTPSIAASPTSRADLSTGTKAGIGVGVGLGVPIIAGLAFLTFMCIRKRRDPYREEKHRSELMSPRDGAPFAASSDAFGPNTPQISEKS